MSTNIKNTRPLGSALATCTLAIAAAAFISAPSTTFANDSAKSGAAASHSAQMDHSKMSGMDGKTMHHMSMTGDVDYDFAVNMRKHHQVAVDMSQKELDKGKNAQLQQLARDIIAAQKKEIAVLDKWLTANKAVAKAN